MPLNLNSISPKTFILWGFILLLTSVLSLLIHSSLLGFIVIVLIHCYLLTLIISAANYSDKGNWPENSDKFPASLFPSRLVALFLFFIFLACFILSFAGIYLSHWNSFHTTKPIENAIDAIYFSLVTLATVGYGEYTPDSRFLKLVVILEILTSVILFIGAFPLLISRLSDFDNFNDEAEKSKIQ